MKKYFSFTIWHRRHGTKKEPNTSNTFGFRPKIHVLKLRPEFWNPVMDLEKTSEVRLNDRNYQVGDLIYFKKMRPNGKWRGTYSVAFKVTHVLRWHDFPKGVPKDYCVLSIKPTK